MTRQYLLEEIERLFVEGIEHRDNLKDEIYIKKNYSYLDSLFREHRLGNEKWEQLVREVLFFDKEDIRYMHSRIMQLARRFRQSNEPYFLFRSIAGTFILPDRLSDLNRLLALYEEFFFEIYPKITNQLNFDTFVLERNTQLLTGKVDWNKTLQFSLSRGSEFNPIEFVSKFPESSFDTPENILFMTAVLRMHYDAEFIRAFPFTDKLNAEEETVLDKIVVGCKRIVGTTILQALIGKAQRYATLSQFDLQTRSLESAASSRVQDGIVRQRPYSVLIDWVKRYRDLNLRAVSPIQTTFPIDRRKNLDTMFELWILFEFLNHLESSRGALVDSSLFSTTSKFVISLEGIEFTLYYEKEGGYTGWASYGKPDFTIEINGKLEIIMDAKNWAHQKDEAIYKMLGYLVNYDCNLGVLFFPNPISLNRTGVVKPIVPLKNHLNQCLVNCVTPFSQLQHNVLFKERALAEVADTIVQHLKRAKAS